MAGLKSASDVDVVELHAVTPVEELILCEALGPRPARRRARRSTRPAGRCAATRS